MNDDDHRSGNLQLVRIEALLKGFDDATKSCVNATGQLVVTAATSDEYGGIDLTLSGGYRLQIFPDGSSGEDWRLIEPGGDHVVIEGSQARVDG